MPMKKNLEHFSRFGWPTILRGNGMFLSKIGVLGCPAPFVEANSTPKILRLV